MNDAAQLAGILGALLAQLAGTPGTFSSLGIHADDRWAGIAALAASIHGRAGSIASDGGPVTASDVAQSVREVIAKL